MQRRGLRLEEKRRLYGAETTYKKKKSVIVTKYKLQDFARREDYDELAYLYISPLLREEKLKEKLAGQEW